MIIRIGVGEAGKEIQLEMAEDTELSVLKSQIDNALEASSGTLWLTDKDGREVGVPASRITFIDKIDLLKFLSAIENNSCFLCL